MRSLRGRLFAYLGLAVLTSTVLTVALAAVLVHRHVDDQRLATLERQADAVVSTGGPPGARGGNRVFLVRAGGASGPRVRPLRGSVRERVLAAVPPASSASGGASVMGRRLLYAVRPIPGGRLVLVRPARLGPGDLRPLGWTLVPAGLAGALIAGLLALLLARRLTRPLTDVSEAAARLAAGERDVAVPVRGRDELSRLAQTFNDMSDELGRAREAERTFLLSVSHELKTPLTAIRGYAEGLEEGAVDAGEAGRTIRAEEARLERLVADLLDLARLDRREFSIALRPVDLGTVAAEVERRHAARARALGVSLTVDAAKAAWVCGDQDRLLQIVSNLVDNALRATPPDGRVTIEVASGALTVRDTGPGLAPDDLPHAFDRFYLHEKLARGRHDGTGLGLAVVGELAAAMGGSASVESELGHGAQFIVRMREAGPAPGGERETAAPSAARGRARCPQGRT